MSVPDQPQPLDSIDEHQPPQASPLQNREQAQATLAQLHAAATKEYSLKKYAAASDFYSQASELQMQLNGEMSLDNADLLYQYGRCLYHLGVSKSDVLGNKVAGTGESNNKNKKKKPKTKSTPATNDALKSAEQKTAEEVVEAVVDEKDGSADKKDATAANKPFFQITGDENWTDSEDEDDDAEAADAEDEDEDDDDFAIAYEILDIARVLLTRKLDSLPQTYSGKGKDKESPLIENPEARQVMDRLADTHDLQAELSLENENFPEAVAEGRAALELKQKLYPLESSLLAEAHFKLALAMEFASVTTTNEEAVEQGAQKEENVDEELRKEAATHMESAIESCRLRVKKEEASLSTLAADKQDAKKREIRDVKEMITDMEQRLADLRTPVAAASAAENPLRGILGGMLGETPADQKQRIAKATANANDLSGLIKKKAKPTEPSSAVSGQKRKLETDAEDESAGQKKITKTALEEAVGGARRNVPAMEQSACQGFDYSVDDPDL